MNITHITKIAVKAIVYIIISPILLPSLLIVGIIEVATWAFSEEKP